MTDGLRGSAWTLRHHRTVTSSKVATLPGLTVAAPVPSHVQLRVDGATEVFRVEMRPGAGGTEVFVSTTVLGNVNDHAPCSMTPIGKTRYNWLRLVGGQRGRYVLLGLAVFSTGTVIQGLLAVGRIKAFVVVSDTWLATLAIAGLGLQVAGGVLTFLVSEIFKDD